MKMKRLIILSILFSIITSCNLWMGNENKNSDDLITVEITGSRTISAELPEITGYELYGAFSGESESLLASFDNLDSASVTIPKGVWDFTLKAKSNVTYILEGGKTSVDLLDTSTPLVFTLEPLSSGAGTIGLTINVPGTVNIDSIVTLLDGVVQSPSATLVGGVISFTKSYVNKGYYILSIQMLNSTGENLCTVSEVVQVLPNLTSSKTITLTEEDFNSAPVAPGDFTISVLDNVNDLSHAGLEFNWVDNSINETGFEIYKSDGVTFIGEVGPAVTTFQFFEADRGLAESYVVRSKNSFGFSDWSSAVSVTTPVVIKFHDSLRANHTYQECIPGEIITPPADLSDPEYLFSGWFTETVGLGTQLDNTTSPDYNMIYYSYWTKPYFNVTFNKNGADGDESMGLYSNQYGNTFTIPANEFTNSGYSFAGWSTTALGDVEYTDSQQITMGASDIELFAVWKYSIVYDGNSFTSGSVPVDSLFYVSGDTATILGSDSFERDGYIFMSWNSAADGSGTSYSPGDVVTFTNSSITLYADWISDQTFISRWRTETDNEIVKLPVDILGSYNFTVDWGDGTSDTITSYYDTEKTHTYTTAGEYTVLISGEFNGCYSGSSTFYQKIIEIKNWGSLAFGESTKHFYRCENLIITATDSPDLTNTTSFYRSFFGCESLEGIPGIENWDVSGITNMDQMFADCYTFTADLSSWNTSNVTEMDGMFSGAKKFNSDLSNWNVSKVTDMSYMFSRCYVFESDLSEWDISSVTDLSYMFQKCYVFTSDLSRWNTSSVTTLANTFNMAYLFNSDLSAWDVSNVTSLESTFYACDVFNSELGGWDISNVTSLESTFSSCDVFDSSTLDWNTSNVTNMYCLFSGASRFDADISNWDTSKVTDMRYMFRDASTFNQDISNWDISLITSMSYMFSGASSFNADISGWNTSHITDMSGVFQECSAFDRDISDWDTSNVTNMISMFDSVNMANIDLSSWNVSNVEYMQSMFLRATNNNTDFTNWDTSKVTTMNRMFYHSLDFNNPTITSFNTSSVTDMESMFNGAESFNVDISSWDTSNVDDMSWMFYDAVAFDQDLSTWDFSKVTDLGYFLKGGKLSSDNYNKLLISLAAQPLLDGLKFYAGYSEYSTDEAETARQYIKDTFDWSFYDSGRE